MGPWFIPIVVTAAGSIVNWVNGKLTDKVDFFPQGEKDPTPRDSTVRIWAGMVGNRSEAKLTSTAGYMPHIILYDERGSMIGKSCKRPKHIKEGNFQDIVIESKDENNVRPAYLELTACKWDLWT